MGEFSDAVRDAQEVFRERTGGGYGFDPQRCVEAATVEPCVERFVFGELDPTREYSAGRNDLITGLPSLAEKLDRRLRNASDETLDGCRRAIRKGLALGYLVATSDEPAAGVTFCPGRDSSAIWGFWAHAVREPLTNLGFPADAAKAITTLGRESLISDLKALRLTRLLGGPKLYQLGELYAGAGALLRVSQTSHVSDEAFAKEIAWYHEHGRHGRLYDEYPYLT